MNPKKALRPQLLDRFRRRGRAHDRPDDRAEVVRRRLAFEADPPSCRWADADRREDGSRRPSNSCPRWSFPSRS
ncbi:MAG: hypothetical protein WKF75_12255 [Singulisphaera sp.]